ncbi:SGNH/GDSL hydrolase family protein [Planococcus sp. CP5-4]|uniref:SGNH/GDSL hydrolase family protein n=1 Tax=unclassified Planococcus (in: firmicutes) TaxID=2662419 RepID=UPI001C234AAB|nr:MULTISPECIES: SGNH/GDSL hydrolase family protein [unclassified Planococcus (in: firmicutes)]MBU9674857.1 SGNH/GDSL hydrolase family protein [Planococcus sp. CP5-4_YE]MBV0910513.1 SGNH/GDSL hydrolase family protein [Planococcus sp. CP5-4_UN]MBW6065286.1 SGNH/GDSL hydrolase family protein [Planococcus sp. CP5-4]
MKKIMSAAAVGLLLTAMANTVFAEPQIPAAYVAIGDSLAAGQTPNRAIDSGYADLIAQELTRNQPLAFYSKDLAFPGFTASDVLESIESDEAKELLGSANIITVSAGANDLLRLVQANAAEGALSFEEIPADYALNAARKNVEKILSELEELAPSADVYVMGYYFAYPHARDSQKQGTAKQLEQLNAILEQEAEQAGVTFVDVAGRFGEDAVDLVPNSGDVHPNLDGYQEMANAFFEQYGGELKVEDTELPEPAPVTFEEIQQMQEEEQPSGEADEAQEEPAKEDTSDNDSAAKPFEGEKLDYLAIRQALPLI